MALARGKKGDVCGSAEKQANAAVMRSEKAVANLIFLYSETGSSVVTRENNCVVLPSHTNVRIGVF